MPDRSDALRQSLAELTATVAHDLAADGWRPRDLGLGYLTVLTRPLAEGVIATAAISASWSSYPRWPQAFRLLRGVGYEPALGLKPLLTLSPEPILVPQPVPGDDQSDAFELDGPAGVRQLAGDLVAAIRDGASFAAGYDVERLVAALIEARDAHHAGDEADETDEASEDGDAGEADLFDVQDLAVMLAAAGRGTQALSVVERAIVEDIDGVEDLEFIRFHRQLRRWVEAGGLPIPEVEETQRRRPPAPPAERPSWSSIRATGAAQKKARATVRAVAKGKNHQDLVALLAREYQAHGVDTSPSRLDLAATAIELEREPLGRLRAGIWAIKSIKDVVGDIRGAFSNRKSEDPAWMRPPTHATYPLPHGRRWVGIDVDPAATPILTRAWADGVHRLGPVVELILWLDGRPGGGPTTVRLGEHNLGTLPITAAAPFEPHLTAAAELYDEAVRVKARLFETSADRAPLLELQIPR